MILPQVHVRKPCYDFYFLLMIKFDQLSGIRHSVDRVSAPVKASLNHSIGSNDGRCVQRAGT